MLSALCLIADVNECENARSNQCGHECHDTLTSYKCVCHSGYRLMTDRHHCRGENQYWMDEGGWGWGEGRCWREGEGEQGPWGNGRMHHIVFRHCNCNLMKTTCAGLTWWGNFFFFSVSIFALCYILLYIFPSLLSSSNYWVWVWVWFYSSSWVFISSSIEWFNVNYWTWKIVIRYFSPNY